jgi:hypothetical protein
MESWGRAQWNVPEAGDFGSFASNDALVLVENFHSGGIEDGSAATVTQLA